MPARDDQIFELRDEDIVPAKKSSSPWKWIGLGCAFFAILIVVSVGIVIFRAVKLVQEVANDPEFQNAVQEASGARSGFKNANEKIAAHHGEVGFGNNEAAIQLAQTFSGQFAEMREEFFTKRKKPAKFSLSDGKFLTYCQLDGDRCAFLVHVPDLRKFDKDAKDSLGMVAWATAQSVIMNTKLETKPTDIAVGLRGVIFYDRVIVGSLPAEGQDVGDAVRFEKEGDDSKTHLYSYFEPVLKPIDEPTETPSQSEPSNPSSGTKPEEAEAKPAPNAAAPEKTDATAATPGQ